MATFSKQFGEWWREYWRPMCGVVYLAICVFDFLVMPVVYTTIYRRQDLAYVVELAEKLQSTAQAAALTAMISSREWKPITLQEGAFFHLAFGAILTGAAITRGLTQSNLARAGRDPWHFNNNGYGNGYNNNYIEDHQYYNQQPVSYDRHSDSMNQNHNQLFNNTNNNKSNNMFNNTVVKKSNIDNPDA